MQTHTKPSELEGGGGARRLETCHKPEHLPGVTPPLSKVRAAARIFHAFPGENKATGNKLPVPHCKHTHLHVNRPPSLPPSVHTRWNLLLPPIIPMEPPWSCIHYSWRFHLFALWAKCQRAHPPIYASRASRVQTERTKEQASPKKIFLKLDKRQPWACERRSCEALMALCASGSETCCWHTFFFFLFLFKAPKLGCREEGCECWWEQMRDLTVLCRRLIALAVLLQMHPTLTVPQTRPYF